MPSSKGKSHSRKHNSLFIRLTESAIFLRSPGQPTSRSASGNSDVRPAQLRGLLVLDLVKPTKITSIDVQLVATSSTAWPEGIGARRVEITEEHRVFHASTIYFQASNTTESRRTLSIGPGVTYNALDDQEEFDNEWDDFRNRSGPQDSGPITELSNGRNGFERNRVTSHQPDVSVHHSHGPPPHHAGPSRVAGRLPHNGRSWTDRRISIDSFNFLRPSISELYPAETQTIPDLTDEESDTLPPIPPYTPFTVPASRAVPSPNPQLAHRRRTPPSETIEPSTPGRNATDVARNSESPDSLYSRLELFPPSPTSDGVLGPSLSALPRVHQDHASSGPLITPTTIPEDEATITTTPRQQSAVRTAQLDSRSRSQTESPDSRRQSRPFRNGSPAPSGAQKNGKRNSRFSFSAVSNAFKDAVRSTSPRVAESQERYSGRKNSIDWTAGDSRGRTMERSFVPARPAEGLAEGRESVRGRTSVGMISKLLGEKDSSENWKEFKKGTYTYPISFSIPGNAPPSMSCDYGSVIWKLKASVHRPGAFKSKMTAVREVITISCPSEEDTEDTENIIVERHWDGQLQYLISVSGRSFYIGGTLPVTFTLMPLNKIKIHRISVFIEERVDYYTNMKRIARSDPITRFSLLSVRGEGKGCDPILPLISDDVEAFQNSPLFQLMEPGVDISEMASSLMGPGPWSFHKDLRLPSSCSILKFTNRNKRSNIIVSHTLKLVMRLERGDDLHLDGKTGKRKLFDIVVQTPVIILSCRCDPDWSALPQYSQAFQDVGDITPACPCQVNKAHYGFPPGLLERMVTQCSSDSSASAADTSPVTPHRSLRQASYNESILRSNTLFERLISGQETESGDAPPAYDSTPARQIGIAVQ